MNDHLSFFYPYGTPLAISAPETTTEEELLILKSASSLVGSGDLCVWVYPDAGELVVARPGRRLPVKPDECVISAAPDYIDYQLGRAMAAETRLRRYAKANKLTEFVTLGYQRAELNRGLDTATRDPERLFGKLRKHYPRFPYAAVAEYGKTLGYLHWHVLLPKEFSLSDIEDAWIHGEVHPESCPTKEDLELVVRYMTKDFADLRTSIRPTISTRPRIPNSQISHPTGL
jgi:hypothetical protein